MDQLEHLRHQKHKPMLNIHERPSSIVKAQFASKRDASFSSYLKPGHLHSQESEQKTDECDQISIFDAAEYFRSEQKEQMQAGSPRVVDLSSMGRLSSVSSVDNGNYRTRSFHATPTASSEVSWSSQTGLLQPSQSGSIGITIIKNPSPSPSPTTTNTTATSTKWGRISSKWLISGRKCPCSGKKSVQVEERIEAKTPRMVDLGRCSSSNGTNYPPSLYSTRQTSPKVLPSNGNFGLNPIPKKFDYNNSAASTISGSTATTIPAAKHPVGSYPCSKNNVMINAPNGFSNHPKVMSITAPTAASPTVVAPNTPTVTNGFTFPVLENPPVGVKKMFNVIAPNHPVEDPHRDSLEVFQPRSLPRSRRASYEEDTALSDGSSDLFEIESFSTSNFNPSMMSMNHHHHHSSFKRFGSSVCRHSLDEETEVESVAPTECYAPSEVSVDWSVTTAEGFDRSSLANFSEVGYAAMRREMENNTNTNSGNDEKMMMRNNKGGGGGLLMSCRCEKAVSVGPGPVNRNIGRNQHVGGRPKEEAATANHVMTSSSSIAGAGNNVGGGVGVMVGRSRPNLMPMPFAA